MNSFCGFVVFGVLNKDDSSSILSPVSRGEDLYTVNEVTRAKSIRLPCPLELLPGGKGLLLWFWMFKDPKRLFSAANQSHLKNMDVIVVKFSSTPIYQNSLGCYHIQDVIPKLGFYSTRFFLKRRTFMVTSCLFEEIF